MARIYADENVDFPVVVELRTLGHDVLTAQEAGQGGLRIPDGQVLAFAVSQGRAVLTFDRRDYIRLHGTSKPHKGIIVSTRDHNFAALANRIHLAICSLPILDDLLIRVIRPPKP